MEPERCAECGFDGTRLSVADAVAALRTMGPRWRRAFEDVPDQRLRRRPDLGRFSPLEAAALTRDEVADAGLKMTNALEGRHTPSADLSAGADPKVDGLDAAFVLGELEVEANAVADRAEHVSHEAWERAPEEGQPDAGAQLRHAVHVASHNLREAERGLGRPE